MNEEDWTDHYVFNSYRKYEDHADYDTNIIVNLLSIPVSLLIIKYIREKKMVENDFRINKNVNVISTYLYNSLLVSMSILCVHGLYQFICFIVLST